jgi:hypothetical protein
VNPTRQDGGLRHDGVSSFASFDIPLDIILHSTTVAQQQTATKSTQMTIERNAGFFFFVHFANPFLLLFLLLLLLLLLLLFCCCCLSLGEIDLPCQRAVLHKIGFDPEGHHCIFLE